WRKSGTLLTFHRMTSADDPFVRVGRQDITASIDFTTVAATGESKGLRTLAFTSQAEFIAQHRAGHILNKPDPRGMEGHFGLRPAILTLSDEAGLGRIRVLLQGRNVPETLPLGFGTGEVALS